MIPVKNVIWRLPNKQEVLQAYLNGSSGVLSLPDSADSQLFWTVSYAEDDKAWAIDEATGALSKVATSVQLNIRCIGVVIE
jgi:hypothetical protein